MDTAKERKCNAFFEWLAGIVSPAQLSELYHAFSGLETAATNPRYPHRLARPLLEETDPAALEALLKDLMSDNRVPRFFSRGGVHGFQRCNTIFALSGSSRRRISLNPRRQLRSGMR